MPAMGAAGLGALGSTGGIAALGSIGGGLLGGLGSWMAGNQQAKGQREALDMFRPYAQMGTGALTSLSKLYGIDGSGQPAFNPSALSQFRNTPGYQFTQTEGEHGVNNLASASGSLLSSNNLRNLTSFNSGLADKTFMGSYVDPLLKMAGIGAGGAQGAAGAFTGQANAQAGGTAGALNNVGGGLVNAGNNYMLYSMLNKSAYGGGNTTPGTLANGGWSTTTTPYMR